ncbi:hypothetical protein [Aeromonas veronii]|uniref:hypothetical protein n=1 Tax=Aeromonas veronii TaxID=654 RepID=UPI003D1ACFFD
MSTKILSVSHPDIWGYAIRYPAGLSVIHIPEDSEPTLLVKLPHQFLLTARINKGFQVYVVPVEVEGGYTIGLISSFNDDNENPLVSLMCLEADSHSLDILHAFKSERITVRMVDEHDRELLGYKAKIEMPPESLARIESARLYVLSHDLEHEISEAANSWFGLRTTDDDAQAITIKFELSLYEEDRKFKDERPDLFKFHGSVGFAEVSLVKAEPGLFQELDIILLLQRIFRPEQIYHAPLRVTDNEEICDVLVMTDKFCIVVQAKDYPNTEKMLSNTFARKRSKAISQLKEGCKQVTGAIRYFRRVRPHQMKIDGKVIPIDLSGRDILNLVVIRERIDYDYEEYSSILMELHKRIDLPCLGIGYGELVELCTYCDGPIGLQNAYMDMFYDGLKTGLFKRMRFGYRDLFDVDGCFRF